ncbi:HEAT repeat domain-containing protein [Georgenia sp. MJ170]|uniref:HEAT repeat domain-containing protein n=1 Tax=Georgenia sunbinii TaxID=3117728 RepID=UPI002F260A73
MATIDTTHRTTHDNRIIAALSAAQSSTRLQAAMAAGTRPDPALVEPLVERCAVEPDFFVRDMLTWALTRHPQAVTVPRLLDELGSGRAQARSQALHTLSKIKNDQTWSAIPPSLLHDADDDVARSAWRAAVVLVPAGQEGRLAAELVRELGRGDRDTQLSLSRALIALGDTVPPMLTEAMTSTDPSVRAHAVATERLLRDPDGDFAVALDEATRVVLTEAAPRPD